MALYLFNLVYDIKELNWEVIWKGWRTDLATEVLWNSWFVSKSRGVIFSWTTASNRYNLGAVHTDQCWKQICSTTETWKNTSKKIHVRRTGWNTSRQIWCNNFSRQYTLFFWNHSGNEVWSFRRVEQLWRILAQTLRCLKLTRLQNSEWTHTVITHLPCNK